MQKVQDLQYAFCSHSAVEQEVIVPTIVIALFIFTRL